MRNFLLCIIGIFSYPCMAMGINIAQVVFDSGTLTDREKVANDSLVMWGYSVTLVDTENATYGNLFSYDAIVVTNSNTVMDSVLINALLSNGTGIALFHKAGRILGGSWSHGSTSPQELYIRKSEAFLEGYAAYAEKEFDISTDNHDWIEDSIPGWYIIGGHRGAGSYTSFYTENAGRGAIFSYDPQWFCSHGWEIGKRVIKYITHQQVVDSIYVPSNNIGFIIGSVDDITPELDTNEVKIANLLLDIGYNITYISCSKVWVSDYSVSRFVISVYDYLGQGFPDTLINSGVSVGVIYTALKSCSNDYSSVGTNSEMVIERNEAFLCNYAQAETLDVSNNDYMYVIDDSLELWIPIGHKISYPGHKVAFYRESVGKSDTVRGAILTYEPIWYNATGNLIFESLARWLSGEFIGIEASAEIPSIFSLKEITPNPLSSTATIVYTLPMAQDIDLRLYDASGRVVRTLVTGKRNAGAYRIVLDGEGLPTGIYFIKLTTPEFSTTRKFMVVR